MKTREEGQKLFPVPAEDQAKLVDIWFSTDNVARAILESYRLGVEAGKAEAKQYAERIEKLAQQIEVLERAVKTQTNDLATARQTIEHLHLQQERQSLKAGG